MATFLTQWFVHALNDEVDLLAQQQGQATRGAVRLKTGVVGKTHPFNMVEQSRMITLARDADTAYVNPAMTKRRAILADRGIAALIDDIDVIKTPADIDSAIMETLAAARNREKDIITINAALGTAETVDEGAAGGAGTVGTSALPTTGGPLNVGSVIVNGGAGLTMTKIIQAAEIMNGNSVPQEDRYFFYSAHAMSNMLQNTQVTSSDYSTLQALMRGGFPPDQSWMGFMWRMVTGFADAANTVPILPKTANIRQCVAWQKRGVGVAVGLDPSADTGLAPHKWNNHQIILKLSMGAVRIQDSFVVRVDIDESV